MVFLQMTSSDQRLILGSSISSFAVAYSTIRAIHFAAFDRLPASSSEVGLSSLGCTTGMGVSPPSFEGSS